MNYERRGRWMSFLLPSSFIIFTFYFLFDGGFGGGADDVADGRPGGAHDGGGVGIDCDRDGAGAKHGTAAKSVLIGMGREQLAGGRIGEEKFPAALLRIAPRLP